MVGIRQFGSTSSTTSGSSVTRPIGFHLSRKSYFSFNGSNFKAQNPRGSDPPRSSHSNLENGLHNDVKFRMIVRRIGAGLENLGNTCFLNSVLQCLTHTEPLVAYLLSGKHQKSCHIVGFCALCAIQNHVSRALQSSGRILAPKDLVSNLRRISRNFRNSRQEDAHEYMVHLLESMHKCCLPSGVPYESPNAYEKSLVHKIFGGSLRSQVKCMECSYGSNKFDPFLDLSLEINKADSLHKALNHFTAAEQLDGGERQYMCQQCKHKVRALKQLTIDKAPYVLTIHLKRFGSHISGQKIDKKVQFGPVLNLKPYVSGSYDDELKYTLYGVLVHAGWSTHSGHYYCFVRTSSGIWYSLDDNQVREVSERTVMEQKAYMLFYVRDGMNFGAGDIASAIQSQKMVPATIPKGPSCSSTPSNGFTSNNKPVNAAQNEKVVATTVEAALCSNSATFHGSQKELDRKSVLTGEKANVRSSTGQKRSGEKDPDGSLESNLPAKKLKTTDASDVPVQHSLPNILSLENKSSNEDSLQKNDGKNLPQSSIESKGNPSLLGSDMQHSTCPRSCNVGDRTADTGVPKVNLSVTSVTSDDKSMKTDLLVSVAKLSDRSTDNVAGIVDNVVGKVIQPVAPVTSDDKTMKTGDKARGAAEETAAKQPVESSCNVDQSNVVINVAGLSSEGLIGSTPPKPKKKAIKYNFPSMHLRSRKLYGEYSSLQKRKKNRKVKKKSQKLDSENLMDEKLGPSTSKATAAVEVHSKKSRKRAHHGAEKSSRERVKHGEFSAIEELISELKRRTTVGKMVLLVGDDPQLRSAEAHQQLTDEHTSLVKHNMNTCNGVADKTIKNLKRTSVERCNGLELPSSQIMEAHKTASISIGYIGDEWDEEYDRGKTKKVRVSKVTFGGPNPFQKIATKTTKLKGKHKHYNPANQPYRI